MCKQMIERTTFAMNVRKRIKFQELSYRESIVIILCTQVKISKFLSVKLKIFSYPSVLTYFFGAKKTLSH